MDRTDRLAVSRCAREQCRIALGALAPAQPTPLGAMRHRRRRQRRPAADASACYPRPVRTLRRLAPFLCSTVLLFVACDSAQDDPASSAATVSQAAWLAATGPQPGEHDVWSTACGGERLTQDYRVVPGASCRVRRDASGQATTTRDCSVGDYCQHSTECQAEAGGVCVGSANGHCEYAGFDRAQSCARDADCTFFADGRCAPQIEGGFDTCYPTRECETVPLMACAYPGQDFACGSDADCMPAPDGRCQLGIYFTQCAYNECQSDADCGPDSRCDCQGVNRCVASECSSDTDCGAGLRCQSSLALQCGNITPPVGYYCHTEQDECQSDADCPSFVAPSCVHDPALARWVCRDVQCITR